MISYSVLSKSFIVLVLLTLASGCTFHLHTYEVHKYGEPNVSDPIKELEDIVDSNIRNRSSDSGVQPR